ncbi:MAG: immunoglobulin-like domain-containing protein [Rectinemataceae bacterium]
MAISFAAGDSANAITKNITLPTDGSDGSTISWNSDAPTVISPTGVVTRDPADDKDVTLTATIRKGSHIEVVSIKVTLKRLTGGTTGSVVNAVTVTLTRSGAASGAGSTLTLGASITVTATTSSPVDSYAWYLDGAVVAGQTSSSYSGGSSLVRGVHTLTAVVNLGGNLFSAIYYFTVQSGVAR